MSTVESVRIGMLRKALRSSGGGRLPEPEDCRGGKSDVRSGAPPAEAQLLRSTAPSAIAPSRAPALALLRTAIIAFIPPARAAGCPPAPLQPPWAATPNSISTSLAFWFVQVLSG